MSENLQPITPFQVSEFGPDHRLLLPAAFLGGAGFLVLADLVARTLVAPRELPVGVVTALVGGPFFLYLLRGTREHPGR